MLHENIPGLLFYFSFGFRALNMFGWGLSPGQFSINRLSRSLRNLEASNCGHLLLGMLQVTNTSCFLVRTNESVEINSSFYLG